MVDLSAGALVSQPDSCMSPCLSTSLFLSAALRDLVPGGAAVVMPPLSSSPLVVWDGGERALVGLWPVHHARTSGRKRWAVVVTETSDVPLHPWLSPSEESDLLPFFAAQLLCPLHE